MKDKMSNYVDERKMHFDNKSSTIYVKVTIYAKTKGNYVWGDMIVSEQLYKRIWKNILE